MKPPSNSGRKRWFLARAMARAYRQLLEKGFRLSPPKIGKPATKRSLHAEALEPRVLLSASPLPADPNLEGGDNNEGSVQIAEMLDGIIDTDATVDGIPGASFSKFGFGDGDLEEEEVARLTQLTLARWEVNGLTEEQIAALEEMDSVVDDSEEGSSGYLEDDTAALRLFVDDPELLDGEFVEIDALMQVEFSEDGEGAVDAGEGVDLLPLQMQEQGQIAGLLDGETAEDSIDLVEGLFVPSESHPSDDGID